MPMIIVITFVLVAVVDCIDNEDNDDDLGFGYVIHDMCGCSVADCKT